MSVLIQEASESEAQVSCDEIVSAASTKPKNDALVNDNSQVSVNIGNTIDFILYKWDRVIPIPPFQYLRNLLRSRGYDDSRIRSLDMRK